MAVLGLVWTGQGEKNPTKTNSNLSLLGFHSQEFPLERETDVTADQLFVIKT